jgi:DNA-directed RNA polymerase
MSNIVLDEAKMKQRGEDRVWKTISSRSGAAKTVTQMQLGQQLIFNDTIRMVPILRDWIEAKCSEKHRTELRVFFADDDFLLLKMTETLLLLASSAHVLKALPNKPHSRHKSINLIESKVTTGLGFDLTWRFIEVLVESSEYFEVERSYTQGAQTIMTNLKYTCLLSEVIVAKLALEAHRAFFPEPLLSPPKDWSFKNDKLVGGYTSHQFDLIRTRSFVVDHTKYSKKIFDAVNYIQSVAWKVNKVVLAVLSADLVIPNKADYVLIEYPDDRDSKWDVDVKDEGLNLSEKELADISIARREFCDKIELYNAEVRDYESALGKYRAIKLAVGIAEQYKNEDNIYFPHSYDFRGRIYPLPVGLSPQGSDGVKAILEYSKGEVLTEKGEQWAWAYLTSLYGEDKLDFSDRVTMGKELLTMDYKEADEPYQFLAHQIELKRFLEDPLYLFKGRVHLDACNSGSQFTSTMTGDVAGCKATNVIPTFEDGRQVRQDAYLLVANKALDLTKKLVEESTTDEERDVLELFQGLLEEKGRKVCKTPVMVSNYGGTAGGRAEIVWDLLREFKVDRKYITKKNSSLYSKILGDSITGVLNGGKAFEGYIHKMNNIISKKNKAVTWETSDGFFVVHVKKKELKPKQVSCLLPGSRKPTTIFKKLFSEDVSSVKMKSAISPNYVHSLDAELLRRVALSCSKLDIVDTDWIHDSFGCHPNNVDILLEITKQEYRKLMIARPLKVLDKQLKLQVDDSKASQKMLEEIGLPWSREFKVTSDFDEVLKSDWFFS